MTRNARNQITSVLFSCLVVACCGQLAVGQDWPQYRGPEGDGKISAESAGIIWSAGQPELVWKKPTPLGFSSFSIADGRAITLVAREDESGSTAQICVAIDVKTGEELWAYALSEHDYGRNGGDKGAGNNRGGDGPRSTPTIDGDYVYVYDAQMLLVCLKADSGDLVWQVDVLKDFDGINIPWSNAISPVIDGNLVLIAGGGEGRAMIGLNKLTGEMVWQTGDEDELMTHATPTLCEINGKHQVIFFMQSGLISLDPVNGSELWRTPFPYSVSTAASPVVTGNLVYCSAGYGVGAGLYKIGEDMSVKEVWRKPNRLINHWSTPVVSRRPFCTGCMSFKKYGKAPLQCVELATGEIKMGASWLWTRKLHSGW